VLLGNVDKNWIVRCSTGSLFPLIALGWKDILLSYKCRKCGNENITEYNVLHYPPYDKSILEVPEEVTQKRYADEDEWFFSRFT